MTQHFVWNPVGNRLATPEEYEQRVQNHLQAPRIVPTGKQPDRDGVYFVTTSNGEVDIDEYGILNDIDDWFWYDCGSIAAWMKFPLFTPGAQNHPFWHDVKDELPKKRGTYAICTEDGHYRLEEFFSEGQHFVTFSNEVVAWAEVPEPYSLKNESTSI